MYAAGGFYLSPKLSLLFGTVIETAKQISATSDCDGYTQVNKAWPTGIYLFTCTRWRIGIVGQVIKTGEHCLHH